MNHDEFVEALGQMKDAIRNMDIASLALTPEEEKLLENLPPEFIEERDAAFERYQASPLAHEFRLAVWNKAAALMMGTDILKSVQKAWDAGEQFGEETFAKKNDTTV